MRPNIGLIVRIGLAAAVTTAGGLAVASSVGDTDRTASSVGQARGVVASQTPGAVVRDARGRVVEDAHGEPLRVGKDGRTVVDSKGRPVRDAKGKTVTVDRARKARRRARHPRRERSRHRRGTPRTPAPRPSATPDAPPVVVGIAYQDAESMDGFFRARGAGNVGSVDAGPQAEAVAAFLNAQGGIGGRRIKLRLHEFDMYSDEPLSAVYERACRFFGSGERPAVVVLAGDPRFPRDIAACLEARGIPMLSNWTTNPHSGFYAEHPDHFFSPGGLAVDRFAAPHVDALADAGFFRGPQTRIGMISSELPDHQVAAQRLREALRARGLKIANGADYVAPSARRASQVADLADLITKAVVAFQAKGVNRVLYVDNGGVYAAIFMLVAQRSQYFPRHALSTLDAPMFLRANLSARNFRDAAGIGWAPVVDVAPSQEGTIPGAREECAGIYRRAGISIGTQFPGGQFSAYAVCDSLFVLRRALMGRRTLREGMEAAGTWESPLAMSARLDRGRHDGVAGYRALRYSQDCECFRYEGPVRPF